MRIAAGLLLPLVLLAPFAPADAEEETGTSCGLYAIVDDGDAGMLKIYDGLRKGLELAHLPRVCREAKAAGDAERDRFLDRLRRERRLPVFAVGEDAVRYLSGPRPAITRVLSFERYTAAGRPLRDLPVWDRVAVVYAAKPAERVGEVLRGLTGRKTPKLLLALAPGEPLDAAVLARFAKATACDLRAVGPELPASVSADAVLHLRLDPSRRPLRFAAALAHARTLGVPLVCDDRGRFGQGAAVILVGRHDLVGKAVAEKGRRLRNDPEEKIPPYGLTGLEVWVDLAAADAQELELPLPFLARADRLKRGRQPPGRSGR